MPTRRTSSPSRSALEHDGGLTVYWKALAAAHLGRVDEARALAELGASLAEAAKQENTRVMNVGVFGLPRAVARQRRGRAAASAAAARLGRRDGARPRHASDRAVRGRGARRSRARRRCFACSSTGSKARRARSRARGGCAIAARCRGARSAPGDSRARLGKSPTSAWPFERARTLLVLGRAAAPREAEGGCEGVARAARSSLRHLPAPLWSERARDELRGSACAARRRTSLTENERRVAELAASGLTNREVAAQLFMSPKTVEANIVPRLPQARHPLAGPAGRAPPRANRTNVGKHPIPPAGSPPIVRPVFQYLMRRILWAIVLFLAITSSRT